MRLIFFPYGGSCLKVSYSLVPEIAGRGPILRLRTVIFRGNSLHFLNNNLPFLFQCRQTSIGDVCFFHGALQISSFLIRIHLGQSLRSLLIIIILISGIFQLVKGRSFEIQALESFLEKVRVCYNVLRELQLLL